MRGERQHMHIRIRAEKPEKPLKSLARCINLNFVLNESEAYTERLIDCALLLYLQKAE